MKKTGKKTMLMSVLMSSPGPLVVGIGLLIGKSSTQLADFIRRSIELLAIILAFVIFCITNKNNETDYQKKERLEKYSNVFVGISMIVSGIIMLFLAIFSGSEEKGNVIPGLSIALLGVIANSIFWFRYKKIGKETNNNILKIQSKLYRAKTFVDCSVVIALMVVMISTNTNVCYYFDLIGTICVSVYLMYSGISILIKMFRNSDENANQVI